MDTEHHPTTTPLIPPHWVRIGRQVASCVAGQDWAAPARGLVASCPLPIWRYFWWVLALAFALRLFAAWHGHWYWRVDEIHQLLEQAHRIVFGYGFIPWEYHYGARSWLPPSIATPPLYVAKWLGVDHPWTYATMVNSWNALLSLSIPIGAYFTMRRMLSERAGRWAFLFACFWYEFIVLAPRTLSEVYSTYFFMAGFALAAGTNRKRWFYAGFLLGIALAIRPHYAPLVGIVVIIGLWQLPWRYNAFAIAGGAAALLLWGLIDKLTWGGWWASVFNYAEYVLILFPTEEWDHLSPWRHTKYLVNTSSWLYPLALLIALLCFHRLWLLWLLVVPTLAIHQLSTNQEYSNIFVILPLLWMLMAGVIETVLRTSRSFADWGRVAGDFAVTLLGLGVFTISLAGMSGKLPKIFDAFYRTDFFTTHSDVQTAYQMHDAIERNDNTVLVRFSNRSVHDTGGFYSLHHNIPVLMLYSEQNGGAFTLFVMDPLHLQIWSESGHRPLPELATHILAPRGSDYGEAEVTELADGYALYALKSSPTYPVQDKWVYELFHISEDKLQKMPLKELTPYNPKWR